jgi:hypothetical protein
LPRIDKNRNEARGAAKSRSFCRFSQACAFGDLAQENPALKLFKFLASNCQTYATVSQSGLFCQTASSGSRTQWLAVPQASNPIKHGRKASSPGAGAAQHIKTSAGA